MVKYIFFIYLLVICREKTAKNSKKKTGRKFTKNYEAKNIAILQNILPTAPNILFKI